MDTGGAPGTTLAQGSFKVTKQYLRYAAHAASDAVFEKLTGIKGAFRTRIAYVVQKNGGQYPYELRVSDYDGYNQFGSPFLPAADVPGRSPDGSKLAYVTFESGRSALVVQTRRTPLCVRSPPSRSTTAPRRSHRMVLNWRSRCRKPVA